LDQQASLAEWVTDCVIGLHVKPNDIAIDVGANYGAHTQTMLDNVGQNGMVLALEPNPDIASQLAKWPAAGRNLQVFACAAGSANGRGLLHVTANPGYSSLSAEAVGDHRQSLDRIVEVEIRTLDSLIPELCLKEVQFVKIDVEGWEIEVLRGAVSLIREFRPLIVLEMSLHKVGAQHENKAFLLCLLQDLNYRLVAADGREVTSFSEGCWQLIACPVDAESHGLSAVRRTIESACESYVAHGFPVWTPYDKFASSRDEKP